MLPKWDRTCPTRTLIHVRYPPGGRTCTRILDTPTRVTILTGQTSWPGRKQDGLLTADVGPPRDLPQGARRGVGQLAPEDLGTAMGIDTLL